MRLILNFHYSLYSGKIPLEIHMPKSKVKKTKEEYSYSISDKSIKEFAKLSAGAKLTWLEEANYLLNRIASKETKKFWEKFLRREI
ncbi:MAG: hypothetical protein V1843_03960 [bacterium]